MAAVWVLKFGGTSVGSLPALQSALGIVERSATARSTTVVVSALAGVTDALLAAAEGAAAGSCDATALVERLRQRHEALLRAVAAGRPAARAALESAERLAELARRLQAIAQRRSCDARQRDALVALGERLAAPIVAAGLQARGVRAQAVDGSELIRTDDNFGAAVPDLVATRRLVRERLSRLPAGSVAVVSGFVGANADGETTTLGRGGSDLSAAVLGFALAAERVEIWSDVDGVMSADPRRDPAAVTLPRLSYAQATELARGGAKVLQPESVAPLADAGIPILVRNTLRPHGPSTWIGADRVVPAGRVDVAIAGFRGQVARSLLAQLAHGVPAGGELRVVAAFQREQLRSDPGGLLPRALLEESDAGETLPWRVALSRLRDARVAPLVLLDCTASAELASEYAGLLGAGVAVVTPNKHAGCLPFAEYEGLRALARAGVPWRYATTVGAGLPVLRALSELRRGGDRLDSLAAVLSGTLSFVLERVQAGVAFSQAVAEARALGLTEPDPNQDLSGEDVARKLLIALREAGLRRERDDIAVESLVPPEALAPQATDLVWAERAQRAQAAGLRLAHVARWDGLGARVGVEELPVSDPLARAAAGENVIVIRSQRYAHVPLTLSGPGAGPDVTARGVLTDLLAAAEELRREAAPRAGAPAPWREAQPHGACY